MKARKINYKSVIKKLKAVQSEIKSKEKILIVLAEKLNNGSYRIAETTKEYKRKDFIIENEKEFNNYIENLKNEECTIIIDDELISLTEEVSEKITKQCTKKELKTIINDLEETETDKIILKNIKTITGDDENEII